MDSCDDPDFSFPDRANSIAVSLMSGHLFFFLPPALLTVDNCSVVGSGGGRRAVGSGGAPPTILLAMATGDTAMADIAVPMMPEPQAVRCRTFRPGDRGGDGSLRRMVPPAGLLVPATAESTPPEAINGTDVPFSANASDFCS